MTNIKQLLEGQKNFYNDNFNGVNAGCDGCSSSIEKANEVFDWHKQSIIKILQAEIERKKVRKSLLEMRQESNDIHESGKLVGEIKALDEDITHLTNIINNLK